MPFNSKVLIRNRVQHHPNRLYCGLSISSVALNPSKSGRLLMLRVGIGEVFRSSPCPIPWVNRFQSERKPLHLQAKHNQSALTIGTSNLLQPEKSPYFTKFLKASCALRSITEDANISSGHG